MTKQFLAAAFTAAILVAVPALAQGTNPSPTGNSSAALSGKGDIEQGNDANMLPNGARNVKPKTTYSGSSSTDTAIAPTTAGGSTTTSGTTSTTNSGSAGSSDK